MLERRNRPAGGGGGACFVPVSTAEEVTKTIWNCPKALTASSDRCYCPQRSNTTGWSREGKRTTRREYREDTQSSGEVSTHTHTRESRVSDGGSGQMGAAGEETARLISTTLPFQNM